MVEDEKNRRLDALLDSLLSDYSAAVPRPGLERRIRAGLEAHATQRRRQWLLVFAAAAVVVVVAVLIARTHAPQEIVPNRIAVHESAPAPVTGPVRTVRSSPHKTAGPTVDDRRARAGSGSNNRILLQAVNAMPSADNTVFEHERLYLSPEPRQEPAPMVEEHASAPAINIQRLGVRPIEIKELTSAKDTN